MSENGDEEEPLPIAPQPPRAIEKTPMFTAMNAARYQRQILIRDIEITQPKLLCYITGNKAPVDRADTLGFVDMLHNVNPGDPIDLMLHTPGGDVDAAEKLITLVRSTTGEEGQLRVIVPDYAKSAGTLMALGANTIVMSNSSELGPIDPQVSSKDGNGNDVVYSVLTYLYAYEEATQALREMPEDVASRITFEKFDPTYGPKVHIGQGSGAPLCREPIETAWCKFLENRRRTDGHQQISVAWADDWVGSRPQHRAYDRLSAAV